MESILIFGIIGICLVVLTMAWASYLGWVTRRRGPGTEPFLESAP